MAVNIYLNQFLKRHVPGKTKRFPPGTVNVKLIKSCLHPDRLRLRLPEISSPYKYCGDFSFFHLSDMSLLMKHHENCW